MMKTFIRKYKTWLIIIVLLIAGYSIWGPKKTTVAVPTEKDLVTVSSGEISSTLQVLGTTKLVTSQTLTFGAGGKVAKVLVKQGDKVKKGAILAELDKRDINNSIEAQQLAMQSAEINYNKLFSSTKPYQIEQVQLNATQASEQAKTNALEIQQLTSDKANKIQEQNDIIAEKEKTLATLNTSGDSSSLANYNAQAATAQNDALDSLQQAQDAVRTLTDLFYINQIGASIIPFIFAGTAGNNGQVTSALAALQTSINSFQTVYNNFATSSDKSTTAILALENANKTLLQSFSDTTKLANTTINSAVTDGRYYPSTQLATDRNTISSMNSKVLSLLNNINSNIKQSQSNDTDRLSLQNAIASAKRQIDQLTLSYDLQIAQKQSSLESNSGSANIYTQNAESLIEGPTSDEKASIQNQIAQAKVNLEKVQKQLEDYQITAEFDGNVTSVGCSVGDHVNAMSGGAGINIEVPGIYEVNVLLDQLDIVKVHLGQAATIVFSAYPDDVFTGEISKIDPTPITDQGVVSYKATIVLKQDGKSIYNNMSATVNIELEKKTNVIVIPSLSITSTGDTKTVQVWNNGTIQTRKIVTGLSDGQHTEVISGLTAGEKITTKVFALKASTAASSIFGSPGSRKGTSGSSSNTRTSSGQPPAGGGGPGN